MKTEKDRFDEIMYEDLTEDLQIIADYCGIDPVRNLMRRWQGATFYIPKISHLGKFVRRYIAEHKELTIEQISTYLQVTPQFLRKIRRNELGRLQ